MLNMGVALVGVALVHPVRKCCREPGELNLSFKYIVHGEVECLLCRQ